MPTIPYCHHSSREVHRTMAPTHPVPRFQVTLQLCPHQFSAHCWFAARGRFTCMSTSEKAATPLPTAPIAPHEMHAMFCSVYPTRTWAKVCRWVSLSGPLLFLGAREEDGSQRRRFTSMSTQPWVASREQRSRELEPRQSRRFRKRPPRL